MVRSVSVIVAATVGKSGIGKDGTLPWRLPEDMKYFREITTSTGQEGKMNVVIMGRKTWDSIPEKFRPLKDRVNVVLTQTKSIEDFGADAEKRPSFVAPSVAKALEMIEAKDKDQKEFGEVFVIGGAAAYEEAMGMKQHCQKIFMTRVAKQFECDVFFPAVDEESFRVAAVSETKSHEGTPFDFVVYERIQGGGGGVPTPAGGGYKVPGPSAQQAGATAVDVLQRPLGGGAFRHEEYQYLELIRECMAEGFEASDRTGVGTISKFGKTMRFDLRHSFPLLTTKRVFWRGVAEELLWFIKGTTNAKELQDKDIHIWDGNASKDFLEKRGLGHREEGDLGPVYGFQWRHFGAKYVDMHTDYTGQGVDQLAECVHKIKNNPNDRRIIMSAWNPADLDQMALPPCHMFCQFYVAKGELSCLMYQRSCDLGLGVPFNIASYALLTCMLAQVCDLKPGEFVHTMGNTHVYSNHVEPLKTQLPRVPRPFPTLKMNPEVKDIDGFKFSDFELIGYNPHAKIAMEMAV